MDKDFLIELTNKLYRLTLLFPKKEPLRYKIRETADEILADLVYWQSLKSPNPGLYIEASEKRQKETIFELEKGLEVLNSYFEVAKWQNWINYFEVLEIQEEYAKIKDNLMGEIKGIEIKEESFPQAQFLANERVFEPISEKIKEKTQIYSQRTELEPRKEKILKILGRVERIQVGEINKLFPEVSKRTIRRDFQKLVKQGILERIGEKNNTIYRIKTS